MLAITACGVPQNSIEVKTAREAAAANCDQTGKCVKDPRGLVLYNSDLVTENFVLKRQDSNQTLLTKLINLIDEPKLLVAADKLEPLMRGVALVRESEPCDSPKGIDGANPTAGKLRALKEGRYKACITYIGDGLFRRAYSLAPIDVDTTAPEIDGNGVAHSNLTPISANLSWAKAGDNLTLDGKLLYKIYTSTIQPMNSLEAVRLYGSLSSGRMLGGTGYVISGLSEVRTYHAAVVVADEAGNESLVGSTTFQTSAADNQPPSLTISSTAQPITSLTPIPVTINFSETVTGFEVSDLVITGGTIQGFSGSNAVYTFTILPSSEGTVAINVAAGVATDSAGNANIAATPFSLVFDSTAPVQPLILDPAKSFNASFSTTISQGVPVDANFKEFRYTLNGADPTCSTGTASSMQPTSVTIPAETTTLRAVTCDHVGQISPVNISTFTYDSSVPTVAITSTPASGPTNNSAITLTFTFSEPVTGFVSSDVALTNATAGTFTATSSTVYTLAITATGPSVSASVPANSATDSASNGNIASTPWAITYDNTPPTVTITSTASATTNVSPIPVTIAFSESVTGFDVSDLTVGNGSAGSFLGSGTTYTASITPAADGAVTVNVLANVAQDAATNGNMAATQLSRTYDSTPPSTPSVVINSSASYTNSTSATLGLSAGGATEMYVSNTAGCASGGTWEAYGTSKSWTLGQTNDTATVYAKFRDAVGNETVCVNDTIIHDNTAPLAPVIPDASRSFNATFTTTISQGVPADSNFKEFRYTLTGADPTCSTGIVSTSQPTSVVIPAATTAIRAISCDESGQGSSVTSYTYTYDSVAPTVTVSTTEASPTKLTSIPVTFTFSKAVTGFEVSDITVTNGTAGGFSGSGAIYTANITPAGQGVTTINVTTNKAQDEAGNGNAAGSQLSLTYDSVSPTVTITTTAPSTTNVSPIPVTITFSESVTGFDMTDITVTNGSAGSFSGSGATYTASITPAADGLVSVNVLANVAQDAATNGNMAATQISRTYDSTPPSSPSIAINAAAAYTNTTAATLTLSAGEAIEMYVSNTAGCATGGSWEVYGTSKSWTLGQTNDTVTVYAKFRDAVGNETACVSDAIIHDNMSPTLSVVSMTPTSPSNSTTPTVNFTLSEGATVTLYDGSVCSAAISSSASKASGPQTLATNSLSLGTYNIYAKAVDVTGNNSTCTLISENYEIISVPGAPTGLLATALDEYVLLTWTAPGSTGGSAITGYKVERQLASGGDWTVFSDNSSTATSITVTGLTNGTAYIFRVAAKNAAGAGGYSSNSSSVTPQPAFISTWKTDNFGTSSSTQITLPLESTGTYNFTVDWGDGTSNTITSGTDANRTHTYATAGTYTLTISGTIIGFRFGNGGDGQKITNISKFGSLRVGNNGGYFYGASNLTITATDALDLTGTTNMNYAFGNCSSLTTAPSMANWNTSSVTDMSYMFRSASAFNQNIGSWNVGSVTNMRAMFYGATAFNQDIGNWNTANVTNMMEMFRGGAMLHLYTLFNQNIGNWNTAKVTNMGFMFQYSRFNQNIGSWNIGSVTNLQGMFYGNIDFNQNIGTWNTSNVSDMTGVFYSATAFNQDIGAWNTANVTSMWQMFRLASAFNQNIGGWNTANVTRMDEMFRSATFFNQNIGNWNTSNVTNMSSMFQSASAFNQNLGSWNVVNVTNMSSMFTSSGLTRTNYDPILTGWHAQNVKTGVTFSAGSAKYTAGSAAATARSTLTTATGSGGKGWTITDGGGEDVTAPSLTLSSSTSNPTNSSIVVTATFDESVTGFAAGDISVTNGSAGSFSGSGSSYSFTVTPTSDGAVSISVASGVAQDSAGNQNAASNTLNYTYDTQAPGSPSVVINNNASYTTTTLVDLALSATGSPTQMYVTNTAGCATGGAWEAYGTSKSWTLGQASATATVYAKFRDAVGNETACVSDTIIHDNTAPVLPVIADASRSFNSSFSTSIQQGVPADANFKEFRYTTTGVDPTCSTGMASATMPTSVTIPAATTTLKAISCDQVGQASTVASVSFTFDITPPNTPAVTGTTPTENSTPTWSWVSGGGGGNGTYRYKLNSSDLSVGATETTSTTFTPASALSETTHTLYVQERDGAGNWSTSGSFGIQVVPPLVVPNNFGAIAGDSLVRLNWSPVSGATGYNIYWNTTGAPTKASTKISVTGTNYRHIGLTNNTRYYYVITSVNASFESGISTVQNALPANFSNISLQLSAAGSHGSASFADSSINAFVGTSVGSPSIITSESKFGGSSLFFNGGVVRYGGQSQFAFGSGDFTVEMWAYFTASGSSGLYDGRAVSTNGQPVIYRWTDDRIRFFDVTNRIEGTTVTVSNRWYHVALSRASNTTRLFIDGVQEGASYSNSTSYSAIANRPDFGGGGFNGNSGSSNLYVDDVRVTKGVGRYISNFTPPHAEFEGQLSSDAVAPPTFSPAAGSFSTSQSVVLSTTTLGAQIYYTVDGSAPNPLSTVYSGPISVTSTRTIRAIAIKSTLADSAVAAATFTIDSTAPSITGASIVTASPGTTLTPSVTFTSNEAGTVRLFDDATCLPGGESGPISSSVAMAVGSNTIATASLTANAATTIYIRAADTLNNSSCTLAGTYTHDNTAPVLPVIADASRSFNSSFSTSIQQGVPADTNFKEFRYTTNGATPTCSSGTASTAQPTSVTIPAATTTLNVITCDLAGNLSGVASAAYTYDVTPPNAPTVTGTTPTATTTPTWSWTSGGGGGNATYRYKLNSTDLTTGATQTTNTSFTQGTVLSEGIHTLYVQERDAAGNWSASGSLAIEVVTPPGAPTLSTPTRNVGSLSLMWASVSGATSYNLYWSTLPSVSTSSNKISGVVSIHTHTSLTGGTTYYYKLAAVKSGIESALSNEVSAAPYSYAAPTVTGISPNSGSMDGGTSVTIIGTGFVSGAMVSIGGANATGVTFGSATSLTATTPAGALGAKNVVVTNPDGQTGTLTSVYTYTTPVCAGDCYLEGSSPNFAQALAIGTERQGSSGATLTLQFANGASGFKIWKEKGGSRILNASGLTSNGWQQALTRAGTAFSATDFTNGANIVGRVCPPNVFVTHSNMTATGRCLYYDDGNSKQALDVASGTIGEDRLIDWNNVASGRGAGSSYFEGNIKTCADKGMRLPTIYETSIAQQATALPTGDAIAPIWATTAGVPNLSGTAIWTASSYSTTNQGYWLNWGSSLYSVTNSSFSRCVLPNSITACAGDCYQEGSSPNFAQALAIGTERQGPSGSTLTLEFANGTSGFKIWKEQGGTRILNATGLVANGWQQTLTRAGTAFTGTSFTNATHVSQIAGRACPPNVFLDYSNMTVTSRCLYYDVGTGLLNLDGAGTAGVEAQDWLQFWDRAATGRGALSSYYEGNIKTCADKGMRLPLAYETAMNNPGTTNTPTGDTGVTPTWAGSAGVPNAASVGSGWTWTASANRTGNGYYWVWVSSTNFNTQTYNFTGRAVRCVLP